MSDESIKNMGNVVESVVEQSLGIKRGDDNLFSFLGYLWKDVGHPEFYWGLLTFVLVLSLAWWLSNYLRGRKAIRIQELGALKAFGLGGLVRIVPPLSAFILLLLVHRALQYLKWNHLNIFYLGEVLLLTWFVTRTLVYLLRCIFPNGGFLARSERMVSFIIWCVPALDIAGLSDPLVRMLESVSFRAGKQELNLWMIIHGSITVCITVVLALWLASLIDNRLAANQSIDRNVREVLSRVIKAVLSLIAFLFSLSFVGIDVTTLSIFSGALAVGLGFGLQKIASNYVSGFIILLDGSIRLGDVIALDDKTTGVVTKITTRYTVLRLGIGLEYIIPNEYLVNNMVRNLSFTDSRLWSSTSIQVGYGVDLEMVMPLMVQVASEHPRVLKDPAPGVVVAAFADSGINLDLGFWVRDIEKGTVGVRSDINLALWKAFKEHDIEIPFPQREVRILKD